MEIPDKFDEIGITITKNGVIAALNLET